jgi:hypothetical protein
VVDVHTSSFSKKDILRSLWRASYRLLLEATHFELGCPIGSLALEVSNHQPEARKLLSPTSKHGATPYAGSSKMQKIAFLRTSNLPFATYVLATMEGSVMLARAYRSFEPFDQAISQLEDYIKRLMRERAGRRRIK